MSIIQLQETVKRQKKVLGCMMPNQENCYIMKLLNMRIIRQQLQNIIILMMKNGIVYTKIL
ncbi:MAG: hypothetical protein EGP78_00290 [Alistipes shahii]|nr:hypothetical protein [Alistipes shahii]